MLYQVLLRRSGEQRWRLATPPTCNTHLAHLQFHTINRYNAGALLVTAATLSELVWVTQRLKAPGEGQLWALESALSPPTYAAMTPSGSQSECSHRGWEGAGGAAGDHDEPYHFEAPVSEATRHAWAHLLARVQRERQSAGGELFTP